jgi:hypothetical protein
VGGRAVKVILGILIILLGSLIVTLIDYALGINQLFSELAFWKQVAHKVAFMVWGSILIVSFAWLYKR